MPRDVLSRHEIARRRLKRKRDDALQRIGVACIGIVVFLILFVVLARVETFQLHKVTVQGEERISESELTETVTSYFDERFARVIPRSNILFFSTQAIETDINERFPRIATLSVGRDIFARAVHIELTERKLWMVLCFSDAAEMERCVAVSRDGVAYAPSPIFTGNVVTKIIDEKRQDVTFGSEVLSNDEREVIALYTDEHTVPQEIKHPRFILKADGVIEIHTSEGWYVIADTESNAGKALAHLELVLREHIGEDRTNLAYIDTRFGDRVFYREKE